jgi:hypothetical protein
MAAACSTGCGGVAGAVTAGLVLYTLAVVVMGLRAWAGQARSSLVAGLGQVYLVTLMPGLLCVLVLGPFAPNSWNQPTF